MNNHCRTTLYCIHCFVAYGVHDETYPLKVKNFVHPGQADNDFIGTERDTATEKPSVAALGNAADVVTEHSDMRMSQKPQTR